MSECTAVPVAKIQAPGHTHPGRRLQSGSQRPGHIQYVKISIVRFKNDGRERFVSADSHRPRDRDYVVHRTITDAPGNDQSTGDYKYRRENGRPLSGVC